MATRGMFQRHMTCPICLYTFDMVKMHANAPKVIKREADFFTTYDGENPMYYAVAVCPNCGYAAFENDYKDISDESKALIYEKVTKQWSHRNFGGYRNTQEALDVYKMALLCYTLTKGSNLILGKIAMRIAFLYRELNDPREKDFIKHTVNAFEKAYTSENLSDSLEEEITLLFMLGEFNRQLGNLRESIVWFTKALEIPEIKKKRHLELRVRSQWALVSEAYRASKENSL